MLVLITVDHEEVESRRTVTGDAALRRLVPLSPQQASGPTPPPLIVVAGTATDCCEWPTPCMSSSSGVPLPPGRARVARRRSAAAEVYMIAGAPRLVHCGGSGVSSVRSRAEGSESMVMHTRHRLVRAYATRPCGIPGPMAAQQPANSAFVSSVSDTRYEASPTVPVCAGAAPCWP